MRNRIIIAFLFILFCSTAAAQVYRKPVPFLPASFDPKNCVDTYSSIVIWQLYNRLFDHDELLNLKKTLVANYSSKENGLIWDIELRHGIKFHNGAELTTKDVAFTLKRLLKGRSVRAFQLSVIKGAKGFHDGKSPNVSGIRIIDPYRMEIELNNPFPPFLSILASSDTEILPSELAGKSEAEFFKNPIGTGPFKFSQYKQDESVTLIANNEYFGGKPYLKEIKFIKVPREIAIKGFNQGLYEDLEFYYPKQAELTIEHNTIISPSADAAIIAFNTKASPLSNVFVRRAAAMAIDKEKILAECAPMGQLAKGFAPPGVLGYYPDIKALPYDIAAAKEELKLSHLPPSVLEKSMSLIKPSNHPCKPEFKKIVEDGMKAIGLNVTVQYVPLAKMLDKYFSGDHYMISFIDTSDFPEAVFLLNPFHSKNPDNYTNLSNPEIDKLLDSVLQKPDRYERVEIYRKIQDIIIKDADIVPLYFDVFEEVFQPYVKGMKFSPLLPNYLAMNTIYYEDIHK